VTDAPDQAGLFSAFVSAQRRLLSRHHWCTSSTAEAEKIDTSSQDGPVIGRTDDSGTESQPRTSRLSFTGHPRPRTTRHIFRAADYAAHLPSRGARGRSRAADYAEYAETLDCFELGDARAVATTDVPLLHDLTAGRATQHSRLSMGDG
jgi:hypothetical protein